MHRFLLVPVALIGFVLPTCLSAQSAAAPNCAATKLRFEISFPASQSEKPLDGRLLLMLSTDNSKEPRFQISDNPDTQQFFGADVDGLASGKAALIDGSSVGYPAWSLGCVPAGDYYVQALLNIYETYHLANGHTVKLPPDRGEGQQWDRKPGNLYSKPQKIHVDPSQGVVQISLTDKIPALEEPKDSKYVKHLKVKSELLSKFWGTPVYIGAIVLLPEGFDEHSQARYPVVVYQSHFPRDLTLPFRETPPTSDLKGRRRIVAEYSYALFQDWTSGRLPHVIIVELQHANPYYDDSYAVNSANIGPYGDAITQEVIPAVEKQFRGIGQGWARALYGGSTGGWEAAAMQIFYPTFFNDAFIACPDPIDFRAYQIVNLYEDPNALWLESNWGKVPRPSQRKTDGSVVTTMDRMTRRELVLGTHGRSTEQFNIWQAVFSPVGEDGYPKPIYDPLSGDIDHEVANYWKEHYDLRYILQRDWKTLGPNLVGKLHFAVGDMDSYYLNNGVHLMQDFLETTNYPYYGGDFEYGPGRPHCYTGLDGLSTEAAGLTWTQRVVRKSVERMLKTAPAGADVTSWRY
jgi:putative esterase